MWLNTNSPVRWSFNTIELQFHEIQPTENAKQLRFAKAQIMINENLSRAYGCFDELIGVRSSPDDGGAAVRETHHGSMPVLDRVLAGEPSWGDGGQFDYGGASHGCQFLELTAEEGSAAVVTVTVESWIYSNSSEIPQLGHKVTIMPTHVSTQPPEFPYSCNYYFTLDGNGLAGLPFLGFDLTRYRVPTEFHMGGC